MTKILNLGLILIVIIISPLVAEDLSNTIIKIILSSIPTFDNVGARLLLFGIIIIIYLRQIPLWIILVILGSYYYLKGK